MAKMNFEPPSDYYDERVAGIDEKICELVKERKSVRKGIPAFRCKYESMSGLKNTISMQCF